MTGGASTLGLPVCTSHEPHQHTRKGAEARYCLGPCICDSVAIHHAPVDPPAFFAPAKIVEFSARSHPPDGGLKNGRKGGALDRTAFDVVGRRRGREKRAARRRASAVSRHQI